jgi:hypothetical protein
LGLNAEEQIIIHQGQQLNNDKVVAELRLTKKSVIYVLHQPVGGGHPSKVNVRDLNDKQHTIMLGMEHETV